MALELKTSVDPEVDILDNGDTVIFNDATTNYGASGNRERSDLSLYLLVYRETLSGSFYVKPSEYDPVSADSWVVRLPKGGVYSAKLFAVEGYEDINALSGSSFEVGRVVHIHDIGLVKITDYDIIDGYSYVIYDPKVLNQEGFSSFVGKTVTEYLFEYPIVSQINQQAYNYLSSAPQVAEKARDLYLGMLAAIFSARSAFQANKMSDVKRAIEVLDVMYQRSQKFGY